MTSVSNKRKAPDSQDSTKEPSTKKYKPGDIKVPTCATWGCLQCKACEKFLKRREELDKQRQERRLKQQKAQEIKDAKNREIQDQLRKQARGWVAQLTKSVMTDIHETILWSLGPFDSEQAAQEAMISGLFKLANVETDLVMSEVKAVAEDATKSLEDRTKDILDMMNNDNDGEKYGMFVTPLLLPASSSAGAASSAASSWCRSDGDNPFALDSRKIWKAEEPSESEDSDD